MFTKPLKRLVRTQIEASKMRRLHAHYNAKAEAAYKAMVAHDPARGLSAAQKKRIQEYSKDVFGSRQFAPWLETYSAHRGEFIEGWIPENYFFRVLLRTWPRYHNISAKTITRRILGTESIPDLAYCINGFWLDRDHGRLETSELKTYLFADTDAVFVKADRGARGEAVHKVTRETFDLAQLSRLGNVVVQSAIRQHPFFNQFTPGSVATLRITTVKPPGQPAKNKASLLRLTRGDAAFVTTDAVRVPIVDDRGTLSEHGADSSWISHMVHPDTHVAFSGKQIPGFESAVALCEKLHDESPFAVLIGWDLAIDRSGGPLVMEWNEGAAGIAFSEASLGPCFKNLGWENAWRKHEVSRAQPR